MSALPLKLSDSSPALSAVQNHPVHELTQARLKMEQWAEQVRLMETLLGHAALTEMDRMTVALELATARTCMKACANLITACEERMREQARRLEERWGWLL
jgi:hypothetical protein